MGVTTADRRQICTKKTVPENWVIWIGRSSGFEDIDYGNRMALAASRSKGLIYGTEPNALVTTLVMRNLLIHSISGPVPALVPDAFAYGREFGLFPIHPWGGPLLDWRCLPTIHAKSPQLDLIKNEFYRQVLLPMGGSTATGS